VAAADDDYIVMLPMQRSSAQTSPRTPRTADSAEQNYGSEDGHSTGHRECEQVSSVSAESQEPPGSDLNVDFKMELGVHFGKVGESRIRSNAV
jgi:hypothetical protein